MNKVTLESEIKLDDLKYSWQQVVESKKAPDNLQEIIAMLKQETTKLDRELKFRDILEISIAILVMPVWIYGLLNSAGLIQSIGCVVAVFAEILICYRMIKARKVAVNKNDNIKAYLKNERQKLRQQKELLESIAWWYIAPITISIVLITLGAPFDESGMPLSLSNSPSTMAYWL